MVAGSVIVRRQSRRTEHGLVCASHKSGEAVMLQSTGKGSMLSLAVLVALGAIVFAAGPDDLRISRASLGRRSRRCSAARPDADASLRERHRAPDLANRAAKCSWPKSPCELTQQSRHDARSIPAQGADQHVPEEPRARSAASPRPTSAPTRTSKSKPLSPSAVVKADEGTPGDGSRQKGRGRPGGPFARPPRSTAGESQDTHGPLRHLDG